MEQQIDDLTERERAWIQFQLEAASQFVAAHSPDDAGEPLTLAALDRAWSAWLGTQETDSDTVNAAINAVGVAFGQFLVEGAGLRWVIAADAQGTDLAVYGFPGAGDVLVYPANFVAKRWKRQEADFLERAYEAIIHDVGAIRQQCAGAAKQKPWWKFW